ncbi:FAD binding domain-containing protein [Xylaria arbuscula]|nr:FAD binding domain-containing protein [Xylaria arbuscula]
MSLHSSQVSKSLRMNTLEADVVVVGAGLAGVCAAIAAAEQGSSVVMLERFHGGGTTAISGGVVYAGGGTQQQKEAGYSGDTPENMLCYLKHEVGDVVDGDTLRRFCYGSVERLEWLESHGVEFSGSLSPFRTSYPTADHFLYFSGNEKAHPFATLAHPAPRGHRAVGRGSGGMNTTGQELWTPLLKSAISLGVDFRCACRAGGLVMGDNNTVSGLTYRSLDEKTQLFAIHRMLSRQAAFLHGISMKPLAHLLDWIVDVIFDWKAQEKAMKARTIILTAGGYIMNRKLVEELTPWAHRVAALGTAGDDASGIQLGQAVGGSVSHMDRLSIWRLLYPPESLLEGIVVSTDGQRVAAEDKYGASFSEVLAEHFDGRGFLILDDTQWTKVKNQIKQQTQMPWRAFIQYMVYWAHYKASTIEALAQRLKMDSGALMKTVGAYNSAILAAEPDPVGKLEYRSLIATAPFYAIDISFQPGGLMVSPSMGLGGLRVDGASGMVLNADGTTIPGLYAAGKNAVGVSSQSYISGLALADCVFSGIRAGEHASRR